MVTDSVRSVSASPGWRIATEREVWFMGSL